MIASILLSLASTVIAAPTTDFPAVSPNAYNFVVDSVNSDKHLAPIYFDSETGFLTTKNSSLLTLAFDNGHATVPGTSKSLNLTTYGYQGQVVDGDAITGFEIKDGVLAKGGVSSWAMCKDSEGNKLIYWVHGESPCHFSEPLYLSAVPINIQI